MRQRSGKLSIINIISRSFSLIKKSLIFLCLSYLFAPKVNFKKIRAMYSAIETPLAWSFFLTFISLFTLQSSAVNQIMFNSEYTVIADIYYSVFPYLQDENLIRSQNYVSPEISTKWASYSEILDQVLLSFIVFPTLFFATQFLMKSMAGTRDVNTSSRFFAMCLILYLSSPLSTFEVETSTGHIHKINPVRYVMQSVTGKVINDIEKVMQVNNSQEVTINSVQLAEPRALMNDFKLITNAFIKNVGSSSVDLHTKLNVEFKEGKYSARFEMGGEATTITLLSNESLNKKADMFGIDLASQEKEMVKDYFNALFNHSTKVNQNISNIQIAINDARTSDFTDFDNLYFKDSMFEKDYKEYCSSIYTHDLSGADLGVINTYIEVASQCASHTFLVKHYKNPNFDANKILSNQGELKYRHAMLFGLNNFTMTFDELKSETKGLCASSYFTCAESVQMLARENIDNGFNLGLLATPVHIINKLLSSYIDISGDIMKHRVVSQTSIQGLGFTDRTLNKNADFSIAFIRDNTNYGFEVVNPIDLIDISKLTEPSLNEILDTVSGFSLNSVFQRITTCFNRPNEIISNFKCNSITKELTDLGTGVIQWAISLKSGAMLMSFNASKPKGKALKMAKKGLGKYASSVSAVSAVLAPVAFDNYFKSSPYFSARGAQAMLTTSLILEYFGLKIVAYLNNLAWALMVLGFTLYYIVFGVPMSFFLSFLMKVYATMINTLIVFNRAYINGYSKGISGVEELYDEFIIDLSQILLIGIISLLIFTQLDIALIVIFDFISDYIIAMGATITSQILNIPALLSVLISILILMKNLPKVLLDKVDAQATYLLQELKK
ncbi:hypothetical protein I6F48_00430 [Pseudoalteromonas sp. SWYJ118]|uniref:hypothetical protein n=1 Tax=Pseudoalteromonas sp. SWYJ118 TaxID=2792062 RepID=UPI0018CE84B4|nr:hypothetical protein [Pseudoalteromonas sp. SWYJ118]MBH0074030.1 hypothetical protein [Pseudoalteromonas sp. SWYJ118]